MARGVQRYISKALDKELQKTHKDLKYNNRIKGHKSFVKACDVYVRIKNAK